MHNIKQMSRIKRSCNVSKSCKRLRDGMLDTEWMLRLRLLFAEEEERQGRVCYRAIDRLLHYRIDGRESKSV